MRRKSIPCKTFSVRLAGGCLVAWIATSELTAAIGGNAQAAEADSTVIGVGWQYRPAYEGASSRKGGWIPVLSVIRDEWFLRTTQGKIEGGVTYAFSPEFVMGGLLLHEEGRVTNESAFLRSRGIPNLAPGPAIGYFAEYDWNAGSVPLTALARYRCRWHFDRDRGAQADFRLTVGLLDTGWLRAVAFSQLTLSDRQEMRGYFGVSQELSASSGLPAHTADPGRRFKAFGVQTSLGLDRGIALVGRAEVHRLLGDAAASPLVERKTNSYVGVGIAWRI